MKLISPPGHGNADWHIMRPARCHLKDVEVTTTYAPIGPAVINKKNHACLSAAVGGSTSSSMYKSLLCWRGLSGEDSSLYESSGLGGNGGLATLAGPAKARGLF